MKALRLTILMIIPLFCAPRPPVWLGGKHPDYPPSRYILGAGEGFTLVMADDSARAEVAKQIKVSIKSVVKEKVEEIIKEGEAEYKGRFAQRIESCIEMSLEGLRIAERWHREGKWYSLAVLDKKSLFETLKRDVREADMTSLRFIRDFEKALRSGYIVKAYKTLEEAKLSLEEIETKYILMRALYPRRTPPLGVNREILRRKFSELKNGFKIEPLMPKLNFSPFSKTRFDVLVKWNDVPAEDVDVIAMLGKKVVGEAGTKGGIAAFELSGLAPAGLIEITVKDKLFGITSGIKVEVESVKFNVEGEGKAIEAVKECFTEAGHKIAEEGFKVKVGTSSSKIYEGKDAKSNPLIISSFKIEIAITSDGEVFRRTIEGRGTGADFESSMTSAERKALSIICEIFH